MTRQRDEQKTDVVTPAPLPADAAAFVREGLGEEWSAQPLAGDASVRAYYRISRPDGSTFMLAYYPEQVRQDLQRFVDAYRAVSGHARIAELLRHSDAALLLRDLGDRTLFGILHEDREAGVALYRLAIDLLVEFQQAGTPTVNAPFTEDFFVRELEMAREYYVNRLMSTPTEPDGPLANSFRKLCSIIAQHPYTLCHRDFHGQNLHLHDGELYVIDYQDLRMGPDTYDLASLLRDRGVARLIGDETELELVEHYRIRSGAAGDVRRRYFETLLQRSIKILGTFARQPIERGRLHYLDFIPPTLESIRRCLGELPELAAIGEHLPMDFSLAAARAQLERT